MNDTAKSKVQEGNILTHDPSFGAWGCAVLNWNGEVLDVHCIKTGPENKKRRIRKGDDMLRRVNEINHQLITLIEKYNITYMLSELPHGSQNASASVMIGAVAGMVQTLSDYSKIGIEWYSERDAKKALLNRISANKKEVIHAISRLYEVPWTNVGYKDEAIADALAIHNVARTQSSVLKLFG